MSNSYFRFKQFRIEQDRCAMKVTTDACIQGAWTPVLPGVKRVLDIGSGTGLLSLMLAQRSNDVAVDAIELDADAAGQGSENIAASAWKERISIMEGDVRTHAFSHKYDLIISNPPFFSNSLLSNREKKDMARHTLSLTYSDLLLVISENLNEGGYLSILLPAAEYGIWKLLAEENGWLEWSKLYVRHSEQGPVKRVVSLFGRKEGSEVSESTLVIKDHDGRYTKPFTALLSPFYLDL